MTGVWIIFVKGLSRYITLINKSISNKGLSQIGTKIEWIYTRNESGNTIRSWEIWGYIHLRLKFMPSIFLVFTVLIGIGIILNIFPLQYSRSILAQWHF